MDTVTIASEKSGRPLFIVLISAHGLIRGHDLELGRDADTGGQTKYVVELATALGEHPEVGEVILLTRRVVDSQVSPDYAEPFERLSDKAAIVRIDCGEPGYLRKELLWESLENFSDNALAYLKSRHSRAPHIIHSHYADAGYVGTRLSLQLGVPLVHTGHSLGRSKLMRLLAGGMSFDEIEETYRISLRIEAEENTLGVAERIITSTKQEIEEQYGLYDFYQPERMRVVPPGTDLQRFFPPRGDEREQDIARQVDRFFDNPDKPIILALSRPDPRKNIVSLIEAYGECPALQEAANLLLITGNRSDIEEMESAPRFVLTSLLLAVDKYDLYGRVAYPKQHRPDEVAVLYRLAALSRGVFINPALTEPFGLTLLEAAASGLPVVATEDGGPVDIIANCRNGRLVNPLDQEAMAAALLDMLADPQRWHRHAANGVRGVRAHYSWRAHVKHYLRVIRPLVDSRQPLHRPDVRRRPGVIRKRAIFASLDLNLIGDQESLARLLQLMQRQHRTVIFGIATGRCLDDALATLKRYAIPLPDVLISAQGAEIHYAPDLLPARGWQRHIDHLWSPQRVLEILAALPGLKMQPRRHQGPCKISYFIDPEVTSPQDVRSLLLRNEQTVNAVFSFGQFLDILPIRASKGLALRWCAEHLGFPLKNTLVAGVTGADADMLRGNTLATVVDNRHLTELSSLEGSDTLYFSSAGYAAGILEAIEHYRFFADDSGETGT
jgi:sucrose-phosphate synthase